jgi:hypothetical protein
MLECCGKARRRAGGCDIFIYFKDPEVVDGESNAEESGSEEQV